MLSVRGRQGTALALRSTRRRARRGPTPYGIRVRALHSHAVDLRLLAPRELSTRVVIDGLGRPLIGRSYPPSLQHYERARARARSVGAMEVDRGRGSDARAARAVRVGTYLEQRVLWASRMRWALHSACRRQCAERARDTLELVF